MRCDRYTFFGGGGQDLGGVGGGEGIVSCETGLGPFDRFGVSEFIVTLLLHILFIVAVFIDVTDVAVVYLTLCLCVREFFLDHLLQGE